MSNELPSNRGAGTTAPRAPDSAGPPGVEEKGQLSNERLQALIDTAAVFNAYVTLDPTRANCAVRSNNGAVAGFLCGGLLHRFDIDLELPINSCPSAANVLSEAVGRVEMRWTVIPNSYSARPDSEPPAIELDRSRSQRFSMQEMTFAFGNGREGFRSFGTGRTFPVAYGGRHRLLVAAIGNVTAGTGKFDGHAGHFTLCGEWMPEGGFAGHIAVRIADEQGNLCAAQTLSSPVAGVQRPDSDCTYLMWLAQKGKGPEQQNRPSLTPEGQLRGLNIAVELKQGKCGFTADGTQGFRGTPLSVGEVIGLEEGYGRASKPDANPEGTALNPFQFEGVARYSFHDREGKTVGSIVTNVLEGRRFDFQFTGAPNKLSWRFGFFGPIIYGTGCFRGVEGIFYGASHSFFDPPPGAHIITHCYFARLHDVVGEFRGASNRGVP